MNKDIAIFKNSKSIINDLNVIFSDIKINNEEKKILYPYLQSKLKNIYKKIDKKKIFFKKVDDNFMILLNNTIENLLISKKQHGGLKLNINDRTLIDYISFNQTKNNNIDKNIIIFLKKCIEKYDSKDYYLSELKNKKLDNELIIYINTLLKIYPYYDENDKNNKNNFLEFEYKYLNNLIINYLKSYKIEKYIDIERLIQSLSKISSNSNYSPVIYLKLCFTFFSSKILDIDKFIKKMIFLIIIIYGIILLEYYFSKINNKNSIVLFYLLIFYLILLHKNL
jgi:hypothetical protein